MLRLIFVFIIYTP